MTACCAAAERLCPLTDKSFQSHVRHTHSADEWNRTEQKTLFLNIEIIDEAIENRLKIRYQFNKYGTDKKPHKSSEWILSPYQLLIRNQHYYLMGHTERFNKIVYQRLDKISDISIPNVLLLLFQTSAKTRHVTKTTEKSFATL